MIPRIYEHYVYPLIETIETPHQALAFSANSDYLKSFQTKHTVIP